MIRKFRFFLASNVDKEEEWLTEMSRKGFHFYQYKFGTYYFDEDPTVSYIYQIDFLRGADEAYFQLYEDADWHHITGYMDTFHYFRIRADKPGIKKIYSDPESVKDSLQRMMNMYIALFLSLITIQVAYLSMWRGSTLEIIINAFLFAVILLYVYVLISFRKKINFYRQRI